MVRALFIALIFQLSLYALHPFVEEQIRGLVDPADYIKHQKLIELIFEDEANYVIEDKADTTAIIKKLKENGLLQLFFDSPRTIDITFKTGGSPQFFIKLMRDTLRSIGYYRYFTTLSARDESTFIWKIQFKSEYVIDPVVLEEALLKRNCAISKITRENETAWSYAIDIEHANLSLDEIQPNQPLSLKKSLRPYWLNINEGMKLTIKTVNIRDAWHPDIAIFDEKLRLLKVYKRKIRTKELVLYLPKESSYIKITDSFSQQNIRHGLDLLLEGAK